MEMEMSPELKIKVLQAIQSRHGAPPLPGFGDAPAAADAEDSGLAKALTLITDKIGAHGHEVGLNGHAPGPREYEERDHGQYPRPRFLGARAC